jgi:CheY-like chemotaxis protein
MSDADRIFAGLRVLVVEDQYIIAAEISRLLEPLGVEVVGPFPGVSQAIKATADEIDVALLDVNLQGVAVFPVADALMRRGVPYAFVTAYEAAVLPPVYQSIRRIEKPVDQRQLITVLRSLAGDRVARSS